MTTYYYCADPVGTACNEWVAVPQPQPSLLPFLTVEEANELGLAIIFALMSAYGWKQLKQVF